MHKIDVKTLPELKNCLPPLRIDERINLNASIKAHGVLTPITLCKFKGRDGLFLLDGHYRYEFALKLGVSCPVEEEDKLVEFESVDDAVQWIIRNQFSRRNIDTIHREIMIGRYYISMKKSHGGDRKSSHQNDGLNKTAEVVARTFNVSSATVERCARKVELLEKTGLSETVRTGVIRKIEDKALIEFHKLIAEDPNKKGEIIQAAITRARENKGRLTPVKTEVKRDNTQSANKAGGSGSNLQPDPIAKTDVKKSAVGLLAQTLSSDSNPHQETGAELDGINLEYSVDVVLYGRVKVNGISFDEANERMKDVVTWAFSEQEKERFAMESVETVEIRQAI